uniref:RNase H type-1 domain-containing protein n=1 Tax=Fagus sylvatica TaxID=28930 RepID=A0A2N9H5A5_FAGSY
MAGGKEIRAYVFRHDTWNELVEYEKIEETKLAVTVAVHDEVPTMEHHRDFKSAHIKSPANDLQSAKDESSVEVIERAWDINVEGSQSFKLAKKIKRVADELKSWNKNHFDDVILLCRARMDDVQSLMSCINTYCAWSGQMEGGLGFRTFWNLNQACLAKLAWWVLSKKDSICIQRKGPSSEELLRILSTSLLEHWNARKTKNPPYNNRSICVWSKPTYGQIKLNCDAAVGPNHAAIAVVARDWRGSLVDTSPPWRIQGLISDIKARTQNFPSTTSPLGVQEANTAAHPLSV